MQRSGFAADTRPIWGGPGRGKQGEVDSEAQKSHPAQQQHMVFFFRLVCKCKINKIVNIIRFGIS